MTDGLLDDDCYPFQARELLQVKNSYATELFMKPTKVTSTSLNCSLEADSYVLGALYGFATALKELYPVAVVV